MNSAVILARLEALQAWIQAECPGATATLATIAREIKALEAELHDQISHDHRVIRDLRDELEELKSG